MHHSGHSTALGLAIPSSWRRLATHCRTRGRIAGLTCLTHHHRASVEFRRSPQRATGPLGSAFWLASRRWLWRQSFLGWNSRCPPSGPPLTVAILAAADARARRWDKGLVHRLIATLIGGGPAAHRDHWTVSLKRGI